MVFLNNLLFFFNYDLVMVFLGTDECGARVRHRVWHEVSEKRNAPAMCISKYHHSGDVFQREGVRMWLENGGYILCEVS